MTERETLVTSIAATISDYREGDLAQPTPIHVDTWVQQFADDVQVPMLREMNHVLKSAYFRKERVASFLSSLVTNQELTKGTPAEFWKAANFLTIQQNGNSQKEMLDMFSALLKEKAGIAIETCGSTGGHFIYLDDVMFSGFRIGNDLEPWLRNEAPIEAVLHVILIAIHRGGFWQVRRRLDKVAAASGKKVAIHYWKAGEFENRFAYRRDAEVLWPAVLPDDAGLQAYVGLPHKFPFEPRPLGGQPGLFSSEDARQLLEREFLLAGLKIRAFCENPKDIMRPLGFSPFALGFGSLIITFRNCPNNCPLALWWGNPDADDASPLKKWYPLVQRKTYTQEVNFFGLGS